MRKRLLTQTNRLLGMLTIFMMSILFKPASLQAQICPTIVNESCICVSSLDAGFMQSTISFSGDDDFVYVLYNTSGLYDINDTSSPIPDGFVIPAIGVDQFSVMVAIDAAETTEAIIGYRDGDGNYQFCQSYDFPSCEVPSITLSQSPVSQTVCRSNSNITYGFNYFGFSSTSSVAWQVLDEDENVLQTSTSTTLIVNTDLAAGTYYIEVEVSDNDDCKAESQTTLTITDASEGVTIVRGDGVSTDSICHSEDAMIDYVITPDDNISPSTPVLWKYLRPNGTVIAGIGGSDTGSGTTIDYSAFPSSLGRGTYQLAACYTDNFGCIVNDTISIERYDPSNSITFDGPDEVVCGTSFRLTLDADGYCIQGGIDMDSGSAMDPVTEWSIVGGTGTITMPSGVLTPDVADIEITSGPGVISIEVDGKTKDGCDFFVRKNITILDPTVSFAIEGDTYVCMGDQAEYNLVADDMDLATLPYTYHWELYNSTPTLIDISTDFSYPYLLLTSNGGLTQPVNFTSLTNGIYTLRLVAQIPSSSQYTACGNFTVDYDFEVSDGSNVTQLACNNEVNITIGNNCELIITPDMILEGADASNPDEFTMMITDVETGDVVSGIIDDSYLGKTLEVKVIQDCTGNNCWGYVTIEDKSVPPPPCPSDNPPIQVDCEELSNTVSPIGFPEFDADVVVTLQADGTWLLQNFDNCGDAYLSYSDENVDDCFQTEVDVVRTWTVTDENGATSSCSILLEVAVNNATSFIMPPNYDNVIAGALPAIECCEITTGGCNGTTPDSQLIPVDENGNPHPDHTGRPEGQICAKITVVGYTDVTLPTCGGGSGARKIIREWNIWDACTQTDYTVAQIISIVDLTRPICVAPNEFEAYADEHECSQTIFVPKPISVIECSDFTIEMEYKLRDENGIIPALFTDEGVVEVSDQGGYLIQNLPFDSDTVWVNFKIQDACGNTTPECLTEIALIDVTPPSPACDLNNNIALNENGMAFVGPNTFEDNSFDNCGVYEKVIRRMDNGAACGDCDRPVFNFLSYLGEYNGHHYYLSKDKTKGPKALAYGAALDEYVTVVNSSAENTWINTQVRNYTNDPYYIGYVAENVTNSSSISISSFTKADGSNSNYSSFAAGEPSWSTHQGAKGDLYITVNQAGRWEVERETLLNEYYVIEVNDPCGYTQQEKFCCADIGEEVQVMVRVIDNFGNHRECMVNTNIQDPFNPTITSSPNANMNVDCDRLDGTDYLEEENSDDLISIFGEPTFADNCSVTIDYNVTITSASECGAFSITRWWTATDTYGNSVSFTQTITVGNINPFNEGNIRWPVDVTRNDCLIGYQPDDLGAQGYPTFTGVDACAKPTASHEDQVFEYTEEACKKILRTWTVIDWCQNNRSWTHVQVIKVNDTTLPDITNGCSDDGIDGTLNADCTYTTNDEDLNLRAWDDCDERLIIWYDLDLNSDGSYEQTNILDDDANGLYPLGTHTIKWYVEDICGNVATCTHTFTFADEKDPTPYCLDEVSTALAYDGTVSIWAEDFNLGSYDDCFQSDDLEFSFSSNVNDKSRTFTCDDIDNGLSVDTIVVQMWVTDEDGNQAFCSTKLILQDNHNLCSDPSAGIASIQGRVVTENDDRLNDVKVSLMLGNDEMLSSLSVEGEFAFNNIDMYNSYALEADRNQDPLNGVSTLDLVLIQKHILTIEELDSPYKLIAADANNSESITAIDLLEIRKLILGIYEEYPSNEAWRFVDKTFNFPDATQPWPFKETIELNDLDSNMANQDFIAVKIGDVNGSLVENIAGNDVESRSRTSYNLQIENGVNELVVKATEDIKTWGAQLSLRFDNISIEGVKAGKWNVTEANLNIDQNTTGNLSMSYHSQAVEDIKAGDVLFSLIINANDVLDPALDLAINEKGIQAELYEDISGSLNIKNIILGGADVENTDFVLYQNRPNPFSKETRIEFYLPESGDATLSVMDYNGRVIMTKRGTFGQGLNAFSVDKQELVSSGILYYQVATNSHSSTNKMILLQ